MATTATTTKKVIAIFVAQNAHCQTVKFMVVIHHHVYVCVSVYLDTRDSFILGVCVSVNVNMYLCICAENQIIFAALIHRCLNVQGTYEMYFNVLEIFPLRLMLTNFLFHFTLFFLGWLCPMRATVAKTDKNALGESAFNLHGIPSKKKQGKKCRWLFVWFRITLCIYLYIL